MNKNKYLGDSMEGRKSNDNKYILAFLLSLFALLIMRNAWICDDAYITFRTIDNILNGYGPNWNIAERVQAYTHPLWMFLNIIPYAIIGHIYFSCLIVSILFSVLAVGWFAFKIADNGWIAAFGIAALSTSFAFVDYATSGLENPLTFFLLALFLYVYLKKEINLKNLFILSFLTSLVLLNRMDVVLLLLPAMVYSFWKLRSWKTLFLVLVALSPFFLWEIFSLFYYGFLFPNTAYAKLSTGLSMLSQVKQGMAYLINFIGVDLPAALVILTALIFTIMKRDKKTLTLALGLIIMLLYIIRIGGCFMAGRHFTAPLFLSVILLAYLCEILPKKTPVVLLAAMIILGISMTHSPINFKTYGDPDQEPIFFNSKIANESAFYRSTNSLIYYDCTADFWPSHVWARDGFKAGQGKDPVCIYETIGMIGFYAGPDIHIIDKYALCDPLLARLPVSLSTNPRIGHFRRMIPPGYKETLESNKNKIAEKVIAEYYDKLKIITRDELFSWARIKEIIKFNLGRYDYLIDEYSKPHLMKVTLSNINSPKEENLSWKALGNLIIDTTGLEVDLDSVYYNSRIEISHDNNDIYILDFVLDDSVVASYISSHLDIEHDGLMVLTIDVPDDAVRSGYDKIRIYPSEGDARYCVGHLRILD
jgi:arabinofuranosyltransferase